MAGVAKRECCGWSAFTRWVARLVWTALTIAAVVSCGGHRYPDNWPKMIEKGDCTSINGDYSNSGKAAEEYRGRQWYVAEVDTLILSGVKAGQQTGVFYGQLTHISVEFVPPSVLKVGAWTADGMVGSKVFSGCICKEGRILFASQDGSYVGQIQHNLTNAYSLYLASDGSLVLEVSSGGYSCYVIPWPEADTHYYLFPRAMNAPAKQSAVQ